MSCFRTCLTCQSRSQAPLCHYTRRLITNQSEGTFERLRYNLGGDRPSQTTRLTLTKVRAPNYAGWYFTNDSTSASAPASQSPTYPTQPRSKLNIKL
jgi:hypothetical protein